jgi:hypothetical protein
MCKHIQVVKNHVFWQFRRILGPSSFPNAAIEKILNAEATLRNMNTVIKIINRYCSQVF